MDVVADRFAYRRSTRKRVTDSLEQAFQFGKGRLDLHDVEDGWRRERFSNRLHCSSCDLSYAEPQPNLFSFNSPLGACETCHGFGRSIDLDLDLVIPDPSKSIAEGVIKPWTTRGRALGAAGAQEVLRATGHLAGAPVSPSWKRRSGG